MQVSPARVAALYSKKSSKENIEKGDIVSIKSRKKGWVEAVVAEVEFNYRARTKPVKIRVTTTEGEDYRWETSSASYALPQTASVLKFLRAGGKAESQAIQDSLARRESIEQKKQEKAEMGADELEKLDLQPGDVILYRYSNTIQKEVVAGVNYSTGKVGIERFTPQQKQRYLDGIKERRDTMDLYQVIYGDEFFNYRRRKPSDRSIRWLPATGVESLVQRATK